MLTPSSSLQSCDKKNWAENVEELPEIGCGTVQGRTFVSFLLMLKRKNVKEKEALCDLKLYMQRLLCQVRFQY